MPTSNHHGKVTIEDLLRLKRAERPSAEFWTEFESELRQKQLSALLEKRPWWQRVPQLFARRAYLPIGATAVLAFTLISVRYYAPVQVVQADGAAGLPAQASIHQSEVTADRPVAGTASSPLVNRVDQASARLDDRAVGMMTVRPSAVEPAAPASTGSGLAESPSARFIAANLANLEQSEPELVNAVMGSRLSSPARMPTTSVSRVEQLALIPSNAMKRNRLLAQYNDRPLSPEPTAPEIVRERLARRLGDAEATDRMSRIGIKGDQVSLGLTLRL